MWRFTLWEKCKRIRASPRVCTKKIPQKLIMRNILNLFRWWNKQILQQFPKIKSWNKTEPTFINLRFWRKPSLHLRLAHWYMPMPLLFLPSRYNSNRPTRAASNCDANVRIYVLVHKYLWLIYPVLLYVPLLEWKPCPPSFKALEYWTQSVS